MCLGVYIWLEFYFCFKLLVILIIYLDVKMLKTYISACIQFRNLSWSKWVVDGNQLIHFIISEFSRFKKKFIWEYWKNSFQLLTRFLFTLSPISIVSAMNICYLTTQMFSAEAITKILLLRLSSTFLWYFQIISYLRELKFWVFQNYHNLFSGATISS